MSEILRHSFSKLNFSIDPKSLVAIHKDSYNNFLYGDKTISSSISNILSTIFQKNNSDNEYVSIEYIKHRFEEPSYSIDECKIKDLTYETKLYVTFAVIIYDVDEKTKKKTIRTIKEQEILFCLLPLMTQKASFIIDGVEKMVVCQIHKTPGIFFGKKEKDNGFIEHSSTIIPYRGSRLEFSFSSKNELQFRIDKKKKMPIYYLLTSLGMSKEEMLATFYKQIDLKLYKKDIYSFEYDVEKMIGNNITMNFRDEKGEIIIEKNTLITRLFVRKLKGQTKFYCTLNDIEGQFLYRGIELGKKNLDCATILDSIVIKNIQNCDIKNISIIDTNNKLYSNYVLKSIINNKLDYQNTLYEMIKNLNIREPFILENAEKYIQNLFFTDTNYRLMNVGRYKLNQVLGLDIPEDCTTLTKYDIIEAIKNVIYFKSDLIKIDDVDSLSNRRIRSVGELVSVQFYDGSLKIAKYAYEKLNAVMLDTVSPSDCIMTNLVIKAIKDFFKLSELSQFMEQTNLLSELAHGRKISALGPGGISRERAKGEVRDIHVTNYGRICPIETPDGGNIGLITSLTIYSTINKYGFLETPYRKVVNGVITDQIDYFDAVSEKKYKIGQASKDVICADPNSEELVSARYNESFILVPRKELDYIDVAPNQISSLMSSFIPFLESNDTARALMGCNMQRQAVPLLFSEAPYVATGVEAKTAKESGTTILADRDGKIVSVDSKTITILPNKFDLKGKLDIYYLKNFNRTNQDTLIHQRPIVKIGDEVKAGQIIADGASTSNGEVAIGKNILLAFMPWRGYNYEDSVVISKRLVSEDKFTSIHIEEFEIQVRDTSLGAEEVTRDISSVSEQELRYLDENGIVHIGVNVKGGDILVGRLTPKGESVITSEEKLLKAIFGDKVSEKKDTSLRMPAGTFGTVVDVRILTRRGDIKDPRAQQIEREDILKREAKKNKELEIIRNSIDNELIDILDNCSIDDKHSKKQLSKKDLSSLSIEQKFNLKLCDKEVSKKVKNIEELYKTIKGNIDKSYIKDIEKIMDGDSLPSGVIKIIKVYVATKSRLQPGDKIAGRHGNKGVVSTCVAVEDMPYMEDGTPIDLIFSPVSVPGRMNIGQILETHLGFLSYKIGKKIDQMLLEKEASDNIKKFLLDISTDDNFNQQISKASKSEILEYANKCKNGFYFSTPVFDGCKIADMDRLAQKLGIDNSLQVTLYDGKTGEPFDRKVTVGYMYIIKLHHLVDLKMHARSTGPYNLVTQQPLGGKSYNGGQRLGEMECWALQAYGAAYTLQEMLTVKSDDVRGREKMYEAIINGETRFSSGLPESFNVLCREMRSLGFDIELGING